MKTASSAIASGTLIATLPLGLAFARSREPDPRPSRQDMTAVLTTTTTAATLDAPFPLGLAREASNGPAAVRKSAVAEKRPGGLALDNRSSSRGMDRSLRESNEQRSNRLSGTSSSPITWLRRISTSRDSSRTRPVSVAYTNGSMPVSNSGSNTPMFPDSSPLPLPPNKLVKRSASLSSGSRLPIPTLRRPATSHQRSATLQNRLSSSGRTGRRSLDSARDPRWEHYFLPRTSIDVRMPSGRGNSTGIPAPSKRLYPDRRYVPTLVLAKELRKPVVAELSDGSSEQDVQTEAMAQSTASSPLPSQTAHFEESAVPRRPFSIGDLLSTGPQPLWKRPSTSRGRLRSSKPNRKGRLREASGSRLSMGNSFSGITGHDLERPAKRRDLTDPKQSERSLYSSSSSNLGAQSEFCHEVDLGLGADSHYFEYSPDPSLLVRPDSREGTPPLVDGQQRVPSAQPYATSVPRTRHSAAHSDVTSTVDSDSEYRSVSDNSTDRQSDAAYDSIQTRTTRSSSGRRGPHIETIFDESPPTYSSGKSTRLRDFLSDGHFPAGDNGGRYRHSTIEEEESITSTPVRSLRNRSVTSTPSARPGAQLTFSSSPPIMRIMPDPDDIDWDATDDEDDEETGQGLGIRQHTATLTPLTNAVRTDPSLPFRFGPSLRPKNALSTPLRSGVSPMDKTNLFDWAEQQPSPIHPTNSPPRPRTVHGKKDQDSRGSRPAGRRPVSGMHARSHSVPVVPDLDGKRHNAVANKFGTWGVGSKAVTEDWNEDFDFEGPPLAAPGSTGPEEKRIDSGHEMLVPKSIREQQQNVVANIGLLREWGLLIEELKELRIRAVALDMLTGPYAQAWREVDAMIDLADQETEEQTLEPRRSPPSSPGFDYSAFEDTFSLDQTSSDQPSQRFAQLEEDPAFSADTSLGSARAATTQGNSFTSRPRKDSELVAQSVIAALQSKRSVGDMHIVEAAGSNKVPFDTATLRHIVPYVNGLKRRVKDALRETEGLYSSPHRRTSPGPRHRRQRSELEVAFRTTVNNPQNEDASSRRRLRRETATTDHNGSDSTL